MLADLIHQDAIGKHDVLTIGTAADDAVARSCGLKTIGSVSIGTRNANRAIARVMQHYQQVFGAYDMVHAWTQRAGAMACAAAPRHPRRVSVSRSPVPGRYATTLRITGTTIIAPLEAIRIEWIAAGFAPKLVKVVPPAVNDAALVHEPQLGNGTVKSESNRSGPPFIIGMMHSPVDELDATIALTIAARLSLAGVRAHVVVHPRAHRRAEAKMMSHRLGFDYEPLIVEENIERPWLIAAALDAAVRVGGSRTGGEFAPLLWAMAAGVPVVAEDDPAARELLGQGEHGRLVPRGDINAICAQLMQLHENRQAARRTGASGSELMRERFAASASRLNSLAGLS